jgi:hypothetical protein
VSAFRGQLYFLIVLVGMGAAAMAQDKQIVVRALDGRSGKPLASQHLLVFAGDSAEAVREHKKQYELVTDNDGLATLTLMPGIQWFQVWIDRHVLCQTEPNSKSFSVHDVLTSGLSSPNTCSSVSQKALPGHVVVFARPAHFWERMRQ